MNTIIDYNYNNLRIAILLQLKKDYITGYCSDKYLETILHTKYMGILCDPADPDAVYRAFKKAKVRYQIYGEI
jgi:hypothetical protein